MPKAPSAMRKSDARPRHNPLAEDYAPTAPLKQKSPKRRKVTQEDEEPGVDAKASRKILKIGQDLVEEVEQEDGARKPNPAFGIQSRIPDLPDGEEEQVHAGDDDEEAWGSDEDELLGEEIDPQDRDIFDKFHPSNTDPSLDLNNLSFDAPSRNQKPSADDLTSNEGGGTDLASLILSKIAQHEASQPADPSAPHPPTADDVQIQESGFQDDASFETPPLPPKAIQVYTTIGQLLSRQRSGPLPKPFKILPSLSMTQLPQILDLTSPMEWSPYAHLMSVRLFISAKPDIAQPYLTNILLPKVRLEIAETKKLHVHLYAALKKALYKPACFFKGLLFPLLEDGTCTLREAHIISSVITRVSVPVLHSAAALLRLCDIGAELFTASPRAEDRNDGPVNMFIRCLLEKKYALPFKVVDALVFHFLRFKALDPNAEDVQMSGAGSAGKAETPEGGQTNYKLTVLWHQCLLAFAQRYRNDVTEDQREALLDLVNVRGHKQIGPEVRRELLEGRGRGVPVEGAGEGMAVDGDDTMMGS